MYIHRRIKSNLRLFTALALPVVVMIGCSEGSPTAVDASPGTISPVSDPSPAKTVTILAQEQNPVIPDSLSNESASGDRIDVGRLVKAALSDQASSPESVPQSADSTPPVIFFGTDQDRIGPDDIEKLKPQAEFLMQHAQVIISVVGRADERGTKRHNEDLSLRRAQHVASALESLGVPASQITVKGLGESAPIGDPGNWGENRRVEMHLGDDTLVSTR